MSELDNVFATMAAQTAEDTACDFWIDEDLRVIEIPARGVVIGVENDKDVNRIRFHMNRMWRGNDLSQYDLRINYENAKGDLNFYDVKNKYLEGDVVVFDWIVASDATAYRGDVYFIVVGLVTTRGVINYAFHTTLGKARCLQGLVVDTRTDIPEIRDFMATLKTEVSDYAQGFVDAAAASAAAAKQSENAAAASAASAKQSENNAAVNAANAKQSENNAAASAAAAKQSEQNAKQSENAAAASAASAKQSETNASWSASTAVMAKYEAAASAETAKNEADRSSARADDAHAAASSVENTADEMQQYFQTVQEEVLGILHNYTGGYYRSYDLTLPATAWVELNAPVGRYWYRCDVRHVDFNSALVPMGTLTLDEAGETEKANIATVCQTGDGVISFYAALPPTVDIRVLMTLFAKGTASFTTASDEEVARMLDEI